jgi:hypothetical protein
MAVEYTFNGSANEKAVPAVAVKSTVTAR